MVLFTLKMGRKKLDLKIRLLIERCIISHERSFFIVFDQKARDQVVVLHHVFRTARNRFKLPTPSILWCFKKDNGFSFICHKTQRLLKKKYSASYSLCEEDCFPHFLASSDIQFCHYNDTTSVLGQTFSMLVIQDFEAVTPNILASIIECVEGGGIIIMIVPSVQTFEEISSLKMDAHSRYITSAYSNIDPVFNTRFVLSLADCKNCIIVNDSLKILLCPTNFDSVDSCHIMVRKKLDGTIQNHTVDVLDKISSLCYTVDQNNALQLIISTLKEKFTKSVISLTSPRGRGKSALLGLAISCALHLKYSNICVTSPQIENFQTLFKFILKGMTAFDFKEGKDYSIVHNTIGNNKLISGINIFHDHRQVIKYISPTEFSKGRICDLVVIDEAAAIPLPIVKSWIKSDIVFMASTVNGYEGTGRSLSLKLINQLREQSQQYSTTDIRTPSEKNFTLHEITLNEAIRYANGDSVEAWLNKVFCLDTEINYLSGYAPSPELCQLYYVNKKVLFSYQKVAEKFLQQLTALFVSSHYKNSPNDLLMMADAPSHHLFCLLPPVNKNAQCLPNVLCVIQVALEGKISKDCVVQELSHGKRASGDLIPWIISQQFQDKDFPLLSGARVVRIATHPNYQRMGYGQHALRQLFSFYEKSPKKDLLSTGVETRKCTLLLNLNELEHKTLDYIGVSYGLTFELLKFWKKLEFLPLYLRQTASETTGEHSCIMIKSLDLKNSNLLSEYLCDFLERFVTLLTSAFRNLPAKLALEMLHYTRNNHTKIKDCFTDVNIHSVLTSCSIKRLEAYCNHLVDYHLIMDLMPLLTRCYFLHYFKDYFLSSIQEVILLSIGLQNKSVEEISVELDMETNQVMGLFIKLVKKILQHISVLEKNFRQLSKYSDEEIQNSSMCKDTSSKRKTCNSYDRKSKQQRHKISS